MSRNQAKTYNQLLELYNPLPMDNLRSIKMVFSRDFLNPFNIKLRGYNVKPTYSDNQDTLERVFTHLTTVITDQKTRRREFDVLRAVRLHWIKHHLEEKLPEVLKIFTVIDENRFYVLDLAEKYVVVLEGHVKTKDFFLLTAYYLEDSRFRNLMTKYEKRGRDGIIWV